MTGTPKRRRRATVPYISGRRLRRLRTLNAGVGLVLATLVVVQLARTDLSWLSAASQVLAALLFFASSGWASGRLEEREWFEQQHPDVVPEDP